MGRKGLTDYKRGDEKGKKIKGGQMVFLIERARDRRIEGADEEF